MGFISLGLLHFCARPNELTAAFCRAVEGET